MSDLLAKVREAIQEHGRLGPGEAILVGVSGGCDSMVLLDVVARLARRTGWRLTVAHFNHQLRGQASDGDEQFVRQAALAYGLPCLTGGAEVDREARRQGVSLEMAGRALRHDFLARCARDTCANKILLAHHADDQAETFLLRLARGSGAEALAGMKPVSPSPADPGLRLLRPLLAVTREELRCYARKHGVTFRRDATNAHLDPPRNYVRRRLLPLLERRLQPAIASTIRRVMTVVGDEAEAVEALAQAWLAKRSRPAFARLATAVQRRLLVIQLRRLGLEPRFDWIERLRLAPGTPITVRRQRRVLREADGSLRQMRTTDPPELPVARPGVRGAASRSPGARVGGTRGRQPSETAGDAQERWDQAEVTCPFGKGRGKHRFNGLELSWRITTRTRFNAERIRPVPGREWLDADRVGRRVTLRHWRPGDRFQPLGMGGAVKLQDLFTNAKVPRAERHQRVVGVTEGGEIFWVEGLRLGDGFKLTASTRRTLEWRWRRARQKAAVA